MNFHDLQNGLLRNFEKLVAEYGTAFQTDADKDVLWETYLDSFPERINPIYRTRREHDCSCCRHFIKNIGGIVFIDKEQKLHSLWGFKVEDKDFQTVLDTVDAYVVSRSVTEEFITKERSFGTEMNREYDADSKQVTTWEHFYLNTPAAWLYKGRDTIDSERSHRRSAAEVFARALREISMDAIDTVLELICSNTLYKGAEWKNQLEALKGYKEAYSAIPEEQRTLYAWRVAPSVGPVMSRIRNHSIGTLLTDLSDGMELNEAVRRYEAIVAPANYKRPKAIYTAKMLEDAKRAITDLGYIDSLRRRYAKLDDITVNNILFANRDASKRVKGADVFDEMLSAAKSAPKKFDRVEEIPIEKFLSDVLPGATSLEAFVENKHAKNMVSLITAANPDAPSMFKWGNPFSWAYSGNIADSDIRENVEKAGGNIHGVLRFSIQWNDGKEWDRNDLDAHCVEPSGWEICYISKTSPTGGALDIDIIHPEEKEPAVENIVYGTKSRMKPGAYQFRVHQFANRGGRGGFRAEIEMDGQVFQYDYPRELRNKEYIDVATVTLNADGTFSIKHHLDSSSVSKEVWGVKTMSFVPVTVVMFSPNYWDEQTGIGNKHYLFMLSGCVNSEKPNGFYNEYLKQELVEHKRVFEALGGKMAVEDTKDQLSGLGFSSTQRNELIVKVKGATERVMKIKF